ncbi:hypothetical protein C8R45DRAFT_1068176, partial [Mycena sanguinolenta]
MSSAPELFLPDTPCPVCGKHFLTVPRPSSGQRSPRSLGNRGRFFQTCADNVFVPNEGYTGCPCFIWRDDIPRADTNQPSGTTSALPLFPLTSLSPPSLPLGTGPVASPTKSSTSSLRAARRPCANPDCPNRGHHTGHRNSNCVQQYCKTCCQITSVACRAPNHNASPAAVLNSFTVTRSSSATPATNSSSTHSPNTMSGLPIPLTYEQPMARAIDPSYAQKIREGDHQPATADRFQREKYRKANVNSIPVEWWFQDDTEPLSLVVSVPTYPYFHPKDCKAITDLVGLDRCSVFGYWDKSRWIITDAPIEIKSNSTLNLRSSHVKTCLNGPTAKRRLSNPLQDTPTPVRVRHHNYRPSISPLQFNTTAGSVSLQNEDDEVEIVSSPPQNLSSDKGDTIEIVSPSPSPSKTVSGTFPLKYACDMNDGFLKMETSSGTVRSKFQDVFQAPWIHGTFYLHWNAWKTIRADPALTAALNAAIVLGHVPAGEWHPLRKTATNST